MICTLFDLTISLAAPLFLLRCRACRTPVSLGTAGAAYCIGIAYALAWSVLHRFGILPARSAAVCEVLAYASIALAMPLLLFSGEVRHITELSRRTLLSFALLALSVIAASAAASLLCTRLLPKAVVFGGMAVALYTGGTPNLNTVACAFRLDSNLILAANLSDMVFGGIFYLFLLFLAPRLTAKLLPDDAAPSDTVSELPAPVSFSLCSRGARRNLLLSLLLVLLCAGTGTALWLLGGAQDGMLVQLLVPTLMIGTTLGGIALSFHPAVRTVSENGVMGQYFVCVFCCSIAALLDIDRLREISLPVFAFFAVITTSSFVLHLLLCRLFSIPAKTMLVTATAGIYGPAFVPGVCRAAHAESLLAPGLVVGSLGYAGGTALGTLFIFALRKCSELFI